MRRAKRMSMIVVATALVTTLAASSFPAVAQPTSEHCGTADELQLIGSELFACDSGGGVFFCPEGFVEVDNPVGTPADPEGPTIASEDPTIDPEGPTFLCAPAPSDSGSGGDDGGGSGGGGNGGGSGSGSGGDATPITQEGDQQSEAGQVDQSFEVS
jgi:hypothetical protein